MKGEEEKEGERGGGEGERGIGGGSMVIPLPPSQCQVGAPKTGSITAQSVRAHDQCWSGQIGGDKPENNRRRDSLLAMAGIIAREIVKKSRMAAPRLCTACPFSLQYELPSTCNVICSGSKVRNVGTWSHPHLISLEAHIKEALHVPKSSSRL